MSFETDSKETRRCVEIVTPAIPLPNGRAGQLTLT